MTDETKPAMNTIADLVAGYANSWKGIVDTFTNVEKDKLKELVGAYTQAELDYASVVAKTPNDAPALETHSATARRSTCAATIPARD